MKKMILFSFVICTFISGCAGPALHGIGVYEGSYPPGVRHAFGYHPDGHVEVKINKTRRPVILVLSSYEPVVWNIVPDDEVKIEEIILSGYHASKVTGVDPEVKISRQPFGYAYKSDATHSKFAVKVFEYTGESEFESFQGAYKGALFSIH